MASWFPSARLPRCAASRRKQGANIRIALRGLLFQEVDQPYKWIKANYLGSVSHEIGKRVDVVKVKFAVAIIDDVLDATDFNLRLLHDALDLLNDFVRWRVALDFEAGFRCVHWTRGAGQFLPASSFADVRRAEIKSFTRKVNLYSVEEFAADNFHANNMSAARRNEFLHQRCSVQT